MHLSHVTLQGFKSFAKRTTLEFPQHASAREQGITAIVGPNGSGKSNIADAIRWVLGEQSVKTLRGKKSEDVIFAGSDAKGKLGMAEVSLHLDNTDGSADLDMSEVVITRRLYRSGESEYLINNKKARLQDVAILLARAHFGQRTYSVIGQGMIDHFLVASPAERKEFFDEATGVKEFQIKRHQAVLKLVRTQENVHEARLLMQEIEPHLRSLKRQVSKLEKREEIEKELLHVQRQYFGIVWHDFSRQHKQLQKSYFESEGKRNEAQRNADELKTKLAGIERKETDSDDLLVLQKKYEEVAHRLSEKRSELTKLHSAIEIAKVRQESEAVWEAMPLSKIIDTVTGLQRRHTAFLQELRTLEDIKQLKALIKKSEDLHAGLAALLSGLQRPAPEKTEVVIDAKLLKSLEQAKEALVLLEGELKSVSRQMQEQGASQKESKKEFFELQHAYQAKQDALRLLEERLGGLRVELARVDTRREALEEEMQRELAEFVVDVKKGTFTGDAQSAEPLRMQMYDLKNKLELIGGIDPEVVEEYEEVRKRHEFLEHQVRDLEEAIDDLYQVLDELDAQTKSRRDKALKAINEQFDAYFKVLFGGGRAELIPYFEEDRLQEEETDEETGEVRAAPTPEHARERIAKVKVLAGVDIKAVPPGKRITNLNSLSGGERAMTSIALICAIIAINPSPFVVLDEVDAALDEANSVRFAQIVKELSSHTQFICITHNRATMQVAHLLYGVTMGSDGISNLLSVKLEEAVGQAAR